MNLDPIKAQWVDNTLIVENFPDHLKHPLWDKKIPEVWVSKYRIMVNEHLMQTTFIFNLPMWKYLEFELNIPVIPAFIDYICRCRHRFDIILK